MSTECAGVGIRYKHLLESGIVSDQRRNLETQADYDALFEEFDRESLPQQGDALAKIQSWVGADDRVALTCYERLPEQCRRHRVAEAFEESSRAKLWDQLVGMPPAFEATVVPCEFEDRRGSGR